jgi:competence/damage-inducible protein CinA-like protein
MNAEIVAVGSELLTPQRLDTNSLYLTGQLNSLGVELVMKMVVGDDRRRLAEVVRAALSRSEIVIITGGLGPTEDDVTRDAVAQALGRSQSFHQDICDWIEARFKRMNRVMVENNRRQAFIIDGAEVLPNDRGTAPGQWIDEHGRIIMLLPGPPNELKAMFSAECMPRLERLLPPQVIRTRFYRVAGMPESDLDQLIAPVYTKYENPATTILAAPSDIQIHLRARCADEASALAVLAEVGSQIEQLLGDRIYSTDGRPLEAAVGALLARKNATLAVAESCTGGMLAERITSVAGSSKYFLGGFLTYTNRMKIEMLGIDAAELEQHTAVSEFTAEAMARGAKERTGASYALSVTGVAGPDGGTEESPVGTVWIGLANATESQARRYRFLGDRERIRGLATQTALDLLRRKLGTAGS